MIGQKLNWHSETPVHSSLGGVLLLSDGLLQEVPTRSKEGDLQDDPTISEHDAGWSNSTGVLQFVDTFLCLDDLISILPELSLKGSELVGEVLYLDVVLQLLVHVLEPHRVQSFLQIHLGWKNNSNRFYGSERTSNIVESPFTTEPRTPKIAKDAFYLNLFRTFLECHQLNLVVHH